MYELSGYSFAYLGKESIMSKEEQEYIKKLRKSGAVVPKLIRDLYGKGYHLYIDNWYTSEKLFRHLEENGTAACDTAVGHRLTVPKSMKEESLSKDKYDALICNYTSVRKSLKWTANVAFPFIEEAILNAFILFNKANIGKIRFMHFKLNIIKSIITRHSHQHHHVIYHLLVGRHFFKLIPPTAAKSNPKKKCKMCCRKRVRKEIRYQCRNCFHHPGLFPEPCFEDITKNKNMI